MSLHGYWEKIVFGHNTHFTVTTRKGWGTKPARASHFEPLEHRQLLSAVLPAAAPAGSTKLTGALIGTAGSYQSKGNTIAMAVDGNTNTYFDAPSGVQGWLGFDLGTPKTITEVQYVPARRICVAHGGGDVSGIGHPGFFGGCDDALYGHYHTPLTMLTPPVL